MGITTHVAYAQILYNNVYAYIIFDPPAIASFGAPLRYRFDH